jgi:hypothetical protein
MAAGSMQRGAIMTGAMAAIIAIKAIVPLPRAQSLFRSTILPLVSFTPIVMQHVPHVPRRFIAAMSVMMSISTAVRMALPVKQVVAAAAIRLSLRALSRRGQRSSRC